MSSITFISKMGHETTDTDKHIHIIMLNEYHYNNLIALLKIVIGLSEKIGPLQM